MARKVENGTQGFSAKNATSKPTNKRKQSQQPAGFGDVADLGDLIPVEGQQQETTPATTKTEEQVIESKQEVVSTENKEQTEETIENKKESETNSNGNNGEEPVEVQEEGSEGETTPTDVEEEETPTGEEEKSNEDNDEEEEIMTQTKAKKGSVMELFEEILEPQKELKGYMIEKELIKALEKHGKKIPRKHGGVSALVNRILREGLVQYGMLEEKEENKKK